MERKSRRFVVQGLAALGLVSAAGYALGSDSLPPSSDISPLPGIAPVTQLVPESVVTATTRLTEPSALGVPTLTQPLDNHYRNTAVRIAGTKEFYGVFPEGSFNFSLDVKTAGLVPRVFLNEPTAERIALSADYLRRLHRFLQMRPEYKGPTLYSLGINDAQNFPITFSKEATLLDVLEEFSKSRISGDFRMDPNPIIGANYHFGTVGYPEYRMGTWIMRSVTQLNTIVTDERATVEENATAYYQTTDLQFALKLLHEFSHLKQDEALLDEIRKDSSIVRVVGIDQEKIREAITLKAVQHKARIAGAINLDPKAFAPNEAQANTISQLTLQTLTRINRTDRFPGAEDDDPYPVRADSLLRKFREFVMQSHALDKRWQLAHNWGVI